MKLEVGSKFQVGRRKSCAKADGALWACEEKSAIQNQHPLQLIQCVLCQIYCLRRRATVNDADLDSSVVASCMLVWMDIVNECLPVPLSDPQLTPSLDNMMDTYWYVSHSSRFSRIPLQDDIPQFTLFSGTSYVRGACISMI